MQVLRRSDARLPAAVPVAGIAALFFAQVAALARHRIDYPIMDDWRYYIGDFAMPESLSVEWLLNPAQDTVHVTGKLLDWLYFHGVTHDYSSLSLASFVLAVGTWLVCAVALCFVALPGRRLLLPLCLVAFALPLAANPYWVTTTPLQWLEPVIAYHQMLPVAGLFGIGLLASAAPPPHRATGRLVAALVASLFVSLAYSSGALAMAVFGGTMLALSWLGRGKEATRDPQFALGAVVLVMALLGLAAHVILPMQSHGFNPMVHTRNHAASLPWQGHFWHFLLGLFDRALLATDTSGFSLLRGAAAALAITLPFGALLALVTRRKLANRERRVAVATLSILAAVLMFAVLVAYGRAGFGANYFPIDLPIEERANFYAHSRFFYWWITASLPLVAVAWGLSIEALGSRRSATAVVATLVALALWPKSQNALYEMGYLDHWNYEARYRRDAFEVKNLIRVDLSRKNGRGAVTIRVAEWAALPERISNRRYRPELPRDAGIFARADLAGAHFIRRWGFRADEVSPFPEGNLAPSVDTPE